MFLVMELVEGKDLADALRERGGRGLPVQEAVGYALQASEALQYVHEQQIVHRDVKPANLIVGEAGVVLVDFGIARELESEDAPTVGIGTPRFMAPEVYSSGDLLAPATSSAWRRRCGRCSAERPRPHGRLGLALGVDRGCQPAARADPGGGAGGGTGAAHHLRRGLRRGAGVLPWGPRWGSHWSFSVARPQAPRPLLEGIVRTAAGVFDAASASLALADHASGELVYQAAWGAGSSRDRRRPPRARRGHRRRGPLDAARL